jgi:hypothetical protein
MEQRASIMKKTGGRCHICGGRINGSWQADHILAYSAGGEHIEENYLPAHTLCNQYRWSYLPEEFQQILKLGVWLRTQMERRTAIGQLAGAAFVAYEKRRVVRRKQPARARAAR